MARNQELIAAPLGAWIELTNSDVTTISLQVVNGGAEVRGSIGQTIPAHSDRGWQLVEGEGFVGSAVAEIFSGAGINRVWARGLHFQTEVLVDHA